MSGIISILGSGFSSLTTPCYNSNAYGLANMLTKTAFLSPRIISKTARSLFFIGQISVPCPVATPALISGKIVPESISKHVES